MNGRLGWQIERVILIALIILSVIDFAGMLPYFFAYLLDVIAWTSIAYVIYIVSPTELLFGNHHAGSDLAIICAFVILSIKDLIGNASASLNGLIQAAPSYVTFTPGGGSAGVPFLLKPAEFSTYMTTQAIPRSAELATSLAPHFSAQREQLVVLLTDGARQAAVTATPTGLNGMMLTFYNTLVMNSAWLQVASLTIGFLLLAAASMYASAKLDVQKPSILSMLNEKGGKMQPLLVFVLLTGFFVTVFNLLFEWMTITNDAPLLMVGIIALTAAFIIRRRFKLDLFLEELGKIGLDFYAKVILLFMEKRTILLGLSGFLVLHLITDIGNFVVPLSLGWYKTIYMYETAGRQATLATMITNAATGSWSANAAIVGAYILSLAGLVVLLALPALIWYRIFTHRVTGENAAPNWGKWRIAITMSAITAYVLAPIYAITEIIDDNIVGVNITSHAGITVKAAVVVLIVVAVVFTLCIVIGSINDYARRILMLGPFTATMLFFGVYIYHYFSSVFTHYVKLIISVLQGNAASLAVLPMLLTIFCLTIIFYIAGFVSFLYELWRD